MFVRQALCFLMLLKITINFINLENNLNLWYNFILQVLNSS